MELALGIVVTLLIGVLAWMGTHSSQCTSRSTHTEARLTALEEWRKRAEGGR
jgi:hypothetical protein